jgi:hypothetical protein
VCSDCAALAELLSGPVHRVPDSLRLFRCQKLQSLSANSFSAVVCSVLLQPFSSAASPGSGSLLDEGTVHGQPSLLCAARCFSISGHFRLSASCAMSAVSCSTSSAMLCASVSSSAPDAAVVSWYLRGRYALRLTSSWGLHCTQLLCGILATVSVGFAISFYVSASLLCCAAKPQQLCPSTFLPQTLLSAGRRPGAQPTLGTQGAASPSSLSVSGDQSVQFYLVSKSQTRVKTNLSLKKNFSQK